VIVLEDVVAVAPHLVRDDLVGPGLPGAEGHIQRLVVEQQPHFGLLGGGHAFDGILLDEVADRGHGAVDGLVQPAVHPQRRGEPRRPHGGAPFSVAGDDRPRTRDGGPAEGKGPVGGRTVLAAGLTLDAERDEAETGEMSTPSADRHSDDPTGWPGRDPRPATSCDKIRVSFYRR
jgi:hypothetical protein